MENILKQICLWVISSNKWYSVLEDKEFMKLISALDRNYKLPHRTTISNCIKEILKEKHLKIKKEAEPSQGDVSLTTESWSSRMYKGYISLKVHWVDKNWCLMSILLDFQ